MSRTAEIARGFFSVLKDNSEAQQLLNHIQNTTIGFYTEDVEESFDLRIKEGNLSVVEVSDQSEEDVTIIAKRSNTFLNMFKVLGSSFSKTYVDGDILLRRKDESTPPKGYTWAGMLIRMAQGR